jgi:type IV secretion system protein VirB1
MPSIDLMHCPGLAVPVDVMHHVVNVESAFNPYAIGVVGGHLVHQPDNLPEALATVHMLESRGFNFSLGLAQVNRYNLGKYGLDSYEKAFQACPNLQAGARILAECYNRSGNDWGRSFSCYYSGNFVTGYRHGYVQKIFASMHGGAGNGVASARAIAVLAKPSRRVVGVSRYPVYEQSTAPQHSVASDNMVAPLNGAPITASEPLQPASRPASVVMLAPADQPQTLLPGASAAPQGSDGAIQWDAAFVF